MNEKPNKPEPKSIKPEDIKRNPRPRWASADSFAELENLMRAAEEEKELEK